MSKILRLTEVMIRVGLSRASIARYEAAGRFPRRVKLGERAVGWLEEDINTWIAAHSDASKGLHDPEAGK